MEATLRTCGGSGGFFKFIVIIGALIAVGWLLATMSYHSIYGHGLSEVQAVHNCMDKGGTIQQYLKPDGANLKVCLISGTKSQGIFGIYIEDAENPELNTAYFFKNGKPVRLCDVEHYIQQMGKVKLIFKR